MSLTGVVSMSLCVDHKAQITVLLLEGGAACWQVELLEQVKRTVLVNVLKMPSSR